MNGEIVEVRMVTELGEGRLVDDGTVWVPLRVVAEAAGLEVEWVPGDPPAVELRRAGEEAKNGGEDS